VATLQVSTELNNRPGSVPCLQTSGGQCEDSGKQSMVISKSINSKEGIPDTLGSVMPL